MVTLTDIAAKKVSENSSSTKAKLAVSAKKSLGDNAF